jgi:Domain of unknown function (DUF1707)
VAESDSQELAVRASDADRAAAVERLAAAHVEGRIDLAELEQRVELAQSASTIGELAHLTEDIDVVLSERPRRKRNLVIASRLQRSGLWALPARLHLFSIGGTIDLDLASAVRQRESEIRISNWFGTATIRVPDDTFVELSKGHLPSTCDVTSRPTTRTLPYRLRIRARGALGTLTVLPSSEQVALTPGQPRRRTRQG